MGYRKENVRWEEPKPRRSGPKPRGWIALCAVLAVLAVGLGAWAIAGQVRVAKLDQRVSELEAENATVRPASENEAALDYDPSTVVAEFDGGVVTAAEAVPEYETLASYYDMLGESPEDYAENAKMTVLSGLVESKVLSLKAKEMGIGELTDAERAQLEAKAEADFEENVRYYMQFRAGEGKSEADVRAETVAYLAETGTTLEGVKAAAVQDATQQRLYDRVTAELNVDDATLRSFYEEQLADKELTYTADFLAYEMDAEAGTVLWNPEGVRRVQVLLIPFDADQSVEYLSLSAAVDSGEEGSEAKLDALYETLRPAAQAALDRLNAGEDFTALMAELGSYGPAEGLCIGAQSTLHGDELRDAAMALQSVGDISGIVRMDGGLCILRYAADVASGPVPFEQVADELRSGYEDELKHKQFNAAIVSWIADANVQYYPDRF